MTHQLLPLKKRAVCSLLAACAFWGSAFAEENQEIIRTIRTSPLPKYQQECSSCHVAYPPYLLPASSWKQIMSTLPRHFGSDASLDPATVNELSTWLSANSGTGRHTRKAPPENRITKSEWFLDKHDEVPARAWNRPAVKSAANCAACHTKADQGNFDEHSVRIPR